MNEDLSKTVNEGNSIENSSEKVVESKEEFDVEAALWGDEKKVQEQQNSLAEANGVSPDVVKEIDKQIGEVSKQTEEKIEELKAQSKEENVEVKSEKKEIDRDLIKRGSIYGVEISKGKIIEVEVNSEIQKTNDIKPREYVRVKAIHGTLETDVEIKDLIENNKEEDKRINKELEQELMGKVESKEEYPEGHIMNSNTADKIAQLEAIDWNTLEFSQEKYDQYINSSEFRTIKTGQEGIQKRINEGGKPKYYAVSIYGNAGLNRYSLDDNGNVKLDGGGTVTSGSLEYQAKLAQKAQELGIKINNR